MYYGKMGWSWTELYQLPVQVRNYYYRRLSDIKKKENEAEQAEYNKIKSQARRR